MITIDGENYLVEKELSSKYGFSKHWFRKARYTKNSPKYYTLNDKIYYKEKDVVEWFKENLKLNKN